MIVFQVCLEGVIGNSSNGEYMFKYKCQRWYDALKEHCSENQGIYNVLKIGGLNEDKNRLCK
jgi:uncharacterized membrane protein